jgi:allophanate hydrolase subunit 1
MRVDMEFLSSGDTGLTVVLGTDVAPETSARVLQLCANINAADLAGVIEVVPTYLSLLVVLRRISKPLPIMQNARRATSSGP